MTPNSSATLDSHAEVGVHGPLGPCNGAAGPLPTGSNGYPQPPAPPPPPRRVRRLDQVNGWLDRIPARIKIAGGIVLVVVSTVTFTRMFVQPVDEDAIVTSAANVALGEVSAYIDERLAGETQIAVPASFSWAPCPLSTEARVMIGGDPSTGGKTLNEDRAAPLAQQASSFTQAFNLRDLRLVADTQSKLRVIADDPTAGVALFSCHVDATEVPVPSDPVPPTTVAG